MHPASQMRLLPPPSPGTSPGSGSPRPDGGDALAGGRDDRGDAGDDDVDSAS